MSDYVFTKGDVVESISIMREAAQWLADTGNPLWSLDDLNRKSLQNEPDEFIVMYDGDHNGIATLLLSFHDPFFWPNIPANTSAFVHKVAIRRKFAGNALTKHLISFVADICREKGISCIRLDCDANRKKLCTFYQSMGFSLIKQKQFHTLKFGTSDVAFFERNL